MIPETRKATPVALAGLAALAVCGAAAPAAADDEIAAESRIASVRLFKNGLAVVERTLAVPAAGVYRVADVPEPVHGTFWVESDAKVEVQMTTREIDVPARADGNLQDDLAGEDVVVHLRDRETPAAGKVVKLEAQKPGAERPLAPAGDPSAAWAYRPPWAPAAAAPAPRFLVLDRGELGEVLVDPSQIAWIEVRRAVPTVKRRAPVLLFRVGEVAKPPATIVISYLTRGMAWVPSYRVDIADPKTLSLRQSAVVKNELADLRDAEVFLISGFPNVEFAHVTSPLSLATSLPQFFAELGQRAPGAAHASLANVVSQQVVLGNDSEPGRVNFSAAPEGEGPDLHYQPLGRRTLATGDALSLEVAAGSAPYDRIVEWRVPDLRDENGAVASAYERRARPEDFDDAAWDAVRFRNPLGFPMTTAPALVAAKDRFLGEGLATWANAGEEAVIRITKALSVRTRCVESEAEGAREVTYVGGVAYRKVAVKGAASVANHRAEAIHMLIRRRFSGELVEAEGSPARALREEGVYSVNKRNELVWDLVLRAGEEKSLAYRYDVLVRN
jgi:hypothetical protein